MASIRVRQGHGLPLPAVLSNEGLLAVQTAEKRQWDYIQAAYVDRAGYRPGTQLPAATKSSLKRIATKAREDPAKRGPTGLPAWERGVVLVPKVNWHRVIGGVLVQLENTGRPGSPAFHCYVALMVEGELDKSRPLYLLIPPRVGG